MSAGFSSVPTTGAAPQNIAESANASWVRRVAEGVNAVLRGKLNVTLDITLTANAASTTVKDARIGSFSALLLMPLTSNAAAALYASPYVLVTSQQNGQAILAHANDVNSDKTFRLIIIG